MAQIILFQGDSITDAFRSRDNDQFAGSGYPTLVKAKLGFDCPGAYEFYNRGISGNRVVDLYARIKADMINLKPDYLSILIGVNDVWHEVTHGSGVSAAKFEKVYDWLIAELLEALPALRIIVMEPFVLHGAATENTPERPHRWEYFRDEVPLRAAAARRVAEKYSLPFVPLQSCFDAARQLAPADYWLFDGVHPTAMGHELIARQWLTAFHALTNQEQL